MQANNHQYQQLANLGLFPPVETTSSFSNTTIVFEEHDGLHCAFTPRRKRLRRFLWLGWLFYMSGVDILCLERIS
jgi:hypothetical protein